MPISAVVITKNEDKNIADCLDNLNWCDEKIVIDDNSTDNTVNYAKKLGAKVFLHSLEKDFSMQRNYGLEKANSEWVLFIDADERVTQNLQKEILENIETNKFNEYFIPRKDFMWGKLLNHGEMGNIKLLRLAKKSTGKWKGKVHEVWDISGNPGILKNYIIHYPHPTMTEFLKEINYYTDIRAKELFDSGKKSSFWEILLYPRLKFDQNYFLRKGFLDGIPGLLSAILMSFHSFLVRSKLWLLWSNKKHETSEK